MFVTVEGVGVVNVARGGSRGKSPLLFLHGVGLDGAWWGGQCEAFADTHDVIAVDLPGHGLSEAMATTPTFARLTHAVERVLETVDAGPAHVIGVSLGGMLAQMLAVKRPDLVRSLTLVATLCTFPDPVRAVLRERARVARTEGMARIAALTNERWFPPAFRLRRPDVLDRATRSLLQQPAEYHAAIWEMIAGLDIANAIGAIACPTLVVAGEDDVNAPPAAGEAIARAIANASLHVMPGIGHLPPFEAPAAFDAILQDFLATVDREPARSR